MVRYGDLQVSVVLIQGGLERHANIAGSLEGSPAGRCERITVPGAVCARLGGWRCSTSVGAPMIAEWGRGRVGFRAGWRYASSVSRMDSSHVWGEISATHQWSCNARCSTLRRGWRYVA